MFGLKRFEAWKKAHFYNDKCNNDTKTSHILDNKHKNLFTSVLRSSVSGSIGSDRSRFYSSNLI